MGLQPLTVCKLYIHSGHIQDYETQYAFYIQDEMYLGWTKEEHMRGFSRKEKSQKKEEIMGAENLRVYYTQDSNKANITWTHGDEERDANGNLFEYHFSLVKNKDGIWKVKFLPMQ